MANPVNTYCRGSTITVNIFRTEPGFMQAEVCEHTGRSLHTIFICNHGIRLLKSNCTQAVRG